MGSYGENSGSFREGLPDDLAGHNLQGRAKQIAAMQVVLKEGPFTVPTMTLFFLGLLSDQAADAEGPGERGF